MKYSKSIAKLIKSNLKQKVLKLTTNYQKTIIKLYKINFDQSVLSITDKTNGSENKVFLVDTNEGQSVIKIPVCTDNSNSKYQVHREMWASNAWYKIGIPVPKVILFDDSKKITNFDYVIEARTNGKELSTSNLTDKELKKVMQSVGILLRKMHSVKAEKYGSLAGNLYGNTKSWGFLNTWIKPLPDNLLKKELITKNQCKNITDYFKKKQYILDFDNPKLLHNDIQENNLIINNNKLAGIVDLGDSMTGDPAYDLARAYQGLSGSSHVDCLIEAYGDYDKKRFEYYLLYHACWTSAYFYDHKLNNSLRNSKRLIKKIVGD